MTYQQSLEVNIAADLRERERKREEEGVMQEGSGSDVKRQQRQHEEEEEAAKEATNVEVGWRQRRLRER